MSQLQSFFHWQHCQIVESREIFRQSRLPVLSHDGLVDFPPVHFHFARSLDAEPDIVALHFDHGDHDIVADDETLAGFAGQYQHDYLPPASAGNNG